MNASTEPIMSPRVSDPMAPETPAREPSVTAWVEADHEPGHRAWDPAFRCSGSERRRTCSSLMAGPPDLMIIHRAADRRRVPVPMSRVDSLDPTLEIGCGLR